MLKVINAFLLGVIDWHQVLVYSRSLCGHQHESLGYQVYSTCFCIHCFHQCNIMPYIYSTWRCVSEWTAMTSQWFIRMPYFYQHTSLLVVLELQVDHLTVYVYDYIHGYMINVNVIHVIYVVVWYLCWFQMFKTVWSIFSFVIYYLKQRRTKSYWCGKKFGTSEILYHNMQSNLYKATTSRRRPPLEGDHL